MRQPENQIPILKPPESQPTILGTYTLRIEGPEPRERNLLIIDVPGDKRFKAVDPKTEEEVDLTVTKIVDVYRTVLQEEPPPKYLTGNDQYWPIRDRKRKAKARKSIPVETPTEH